VSLVSQALPVTLDQQVQLVKLGSLGSLVDRVTLASLAYKDPRASQEHLALLALLDLLDNLDLLDRKDLWEHLDCKAGLVSVCCIIILHLMWTKGHDLIGSSEQKLTI